MQARTAVPADSAAIAEVYNEGIEDRIATFETTMRTAADVERWFASGHPIVVVDDGGVAVAFAATFPYRARSCYRGVADVSVEEDCHARPDPDAGASVRGHPCR